MMSILICMRRKYSFPGKK